MGTTSGAAEGAIQPAVEALVPYEAGQLSGVQLEAVEPSELQPVQIGTSKPKSSETRPMVFPSEDHLLEITKLRSLVEHLSDRLEKFEEGKSFGSASSGRVKSVDLEGPARGSDEGTRPPQVPSLPRLWVGQTCVSFPLKTHRPLLVLDSNLHRPEC